MRLTAAVIVGVLAMAGCGGDDDEPSAAKGIDRPADPVLCPAKDGDPAGAQGSSSAFDAREILGLTTADAESTAKDHDCTVRILVEDGQERPATMDFRTERINVEVRDGVVVGLRGVG